MKKATEQFQIENIDEKLKQVSIDMKDLEKKYVDHQVTITKWVNFLHGMVIVVVTCAGIFAYSLINIIQKNYEVNADQTDHIHRIELQIKDLQKDLEYGKKSSK